MWRVGFCLLNLCLKAPHVVRDKIWREICCMEIEIFICVISYKLKGDLDNCVTCLRSSPSMNCIPICGSSNSKLPSGSQGSSTVRPCIQSKTKSFYQFCCLKCHTEQLTSLVSRSTSFHITTYVMANEMTLSPQHQIVESFNHGSIEQHVEKQSPVGADDAG